MSEGTNISGNGHSKVRFIRENLEQNHQQRNRLTIDEVVVKCMTHYFRPITKMVLDQKRQQNNIMKVFNR